MIDVVVRYLEHAPTDFHGMIVHNEDDSYTVLLDPNDSFENQLETLVHEVDHALFNDFAQPDVQLIECQAHNRL